MSNNQGRRAIAGAAAASAHQPTMAPPPYISTDHATRRARTNGQEPARRSFISQQGRPLPLLASGSRGRRGREEERRGEEKRGPIKAAQARALAVAVLATLTAPAAAATGARGVALRSSRGALIVLNFDKIRYIITK